MLIANRSRNRLKVAFQSLPQSLIGEIRFMIRKLEKELPDLLNPKKMILDQDLDLQEIIVEVFKGKLTKIANINCYKELINTKNLVDSFSYLIELTKKSMKI